MALNDRLIGEGATIWWHEEITRQLERIQRDTKKEDIEKEEAESEND